MQLIVHYIHIHIIFYALYHITLSDTLYLTYGAAGAGGVGGGAGGGGAGAGARGGGAAGASTVLLC